METNLVQLPEKTTTTEVVRQIPAESSFSPQGFEHTQRVAKMLASSNLIPVNYQGNIQNTMIAMEMANRIGASPLMVMQNLNIIQGKPSWSSSFIIASLNSCKRFTPLRFEMSGEGDEYGYHAWAFGTGTNEKLEGPKVTWAMVKVEGWLSKPGSKWKTMPELMFRYRAAAFFGRLYAPDILMGMQTAEEVVDVTHEAIVERVNNNKTVIEIPVELISVIAETEDAEKLFDEIYKNNSEYHNNPEFMRLLMKRKKELSNGSTTSASI